jgi:hypothetical protein
VFASGESTKWNHFRSQCARGAALFGSEAIVFHHEEREGHDENFLVHAALAVVRGFESL